MPTKKSPNLRAPERDYSHRLLADKLGIKAGQRISVMGVEGAEFFAEIATRVPDYSRGKMMKDADLIFFSAEATKDLRHLESLAQAIQSQGAIWVVYPKGQKHIREIDVIAAAKSAGLVDNKVCRFSATHTALRLCIPVAKRSRPGSDASTKHRPSKSPQIQFAAAIMVLWNLFLTCAA